MKCYVFDIDGVITDAKTKTADFKIIDYINQNLNSEIVAFNTGRALSWVQEKVLSKINLKDNLYVVCEQGGVWAKYQEEKLVSYEDPKFEVNPTLVSEIRALSKTQSSMFFDEGKKTMISLEMIDNHDINHYKEEIENLLPDIQELISQLSPSLKIAKSIIGTDVVTAFHGKAQGTNRLLQMLSEDNITPSKFITFGDSLSDIEMAETLLNAHFEVEFVYVGEDKITQDYSFEIIKTQNKYTEGTLEYLNSQH